MQDWLRPGTSPGNVHINVGAKSGCWKQEERVTVRDPRGLVVLRLQLLVGWWWASYQEHGDPGSLPQTLLYCVTYRTGVE